MSVLLVALASMLACAPAEAADEEPISGGGVQVYDYECENGVVTATLPGPDVIYMVEHCRPDGSCQSHAAQGSGVIRRDNLELQFGCGSVWPEGSEQYVRLTVIQ